MKQLRIPLAGILGVVLLVLLANIERPAKASNLDRGYKYEVDLGMQPLTITADTAVALTVPNGTWHAELQVISGTCYVRGDAIVPSVATGFPWPAGHWRKEPNDREKLLGLRIIGGVGGCELRAWYFGNRRDQ